MCLVPIPSCLCLSGLMVLCSIYCYLTIKLTLSSYSSIPTQPHLTNPMRPVLFTARIGRLSYAFRRARKTLLHCSPAVRFAGNPSPNFRRYRGGTASKVCMFHKRGLLTLPPMEHMKPRSCTSVLVCGGEGGGGKRRGTKTEQRPSCYITR